MAASSAVATLFSAEIDGLPPCRRRQSLFAQLGLLGLQLGQFGGKSGQFLLF